MHDLKAIASSERFRWGLLFFGLTLLLPIYWLLGFYPGFFVSDTFFSIKSWEDNALGSWQSYTYNLLIHLLFPPLKSMDLVVCFQSILYAFITGYIFSMPIKYGVRKSILFLIFLMFFISPNVGSYFIFFNRDSFFSWFLIFLLAFVFELIFDIKRGQNPSNTRLAVVVLTSAILLPTRTDFLPISILLGLILFSELKLNLKKKVVFLSIFAFSQIFTWKILPNLMGVYPLGDGYYLTLYVNPLSHFATHLHEDEIAQIPRDQKKDLENIVSFSTLQDNYDICEIPAFHKGLTKQDFTSEEFSKFKTAFYQLVLQHPFVFIHNRYKLFLNLTGLSGNHPTWYDELSIKDELLAPVSIEYRDKYALHRRTYSPFIFHNTQRVVWYLLEGRYGTITKIIVMSCFIGLVFMFFGMMSVRMTPVFSSICLLLMVRSAAVFLTAPACQFKYIYSIYLFAFLAPILISIEWPKNRSKKITS